MSDDEGSDNDVPSLSAALGQNSVGGASRPTTGGKSYGAGKRLVQRPVELSDDEDDEDDEDEDDELDEDEDEDGEGGDDSSRGQRGMKRPRSSVPGRAAMKRPKTSKFILDKADVKDSEDEDDEEDEADEEEDDINDEEAEAAESGRNLNDIRVVDRVKDREQDFDVEKMAEELSQRHRDYSKDLRQEVSIEEGQTADGLLLPNRKAGDPSLFVVHCQRGREKEYAIQLMHKCLSMPQRLEISSVIAVEHVKERIYVEAQKQADVETAVYGILGLRSNKISRVPENEMVDVLSVRSLRTKNISKNDWVRIRRGVYKGDLAQVVDMNEDRSTNTATVKLVPRLDLNGFREKKLGTKETGSGKKKKAATRVAPRFFSEEEMKKQGFQQYLSRAAGGFITFDNQRFKDGYTHRVMNLNLLETENINPTLDELAKFQSSKPDEDGEDEDGGAKPLGSSLGSSQSTSDIAKTLQTDTIFNKGDMVQVIEGDVKGIIGTVDSVVGDKVLVQYEGDTYKFSHNELQKYFERGDHVKVIAGRYSGQTGIVVKIEAVIITLFCDVSRAEIQVFSKDLQQTGGEVGTATVVTNSVFDVRDLVSFDAQSVAVVLRVDRDSFLVLDQNGKVRTVKTQEIMKKRDSRLAHATDLNNNQLRVGDTVNVIDGEYKDRKGKILHIFRQFIFVVASDIITNGGIFVSNARNLTLVGGATSTGGAGGFVRPNAQAARRGREVLLQKQVTIMKGPFKGYVGTVTEVNEQMARVELHTKNKHISVSKEHLKELGSGQAGPSQTYGARQDYGGGYRTPSQTGGAQTPMHAGYSGGQTPMHGGQMGSQTPMYGGGRTPLHDGSGGGGRTPAWQAQTPTWDPTRTSTWTASTPSSVPTPASSHWDDHVSTPRNNPNTPGLDINPSSPYVGDAETPSSSSSRLPPTPGYGVYGGNNPETPSAGGSGNMVPATPGSGYGTPFTPGVYSSPAPATPYDSYVSTPSSQAVDTWLSAGIVVRDISGMFRGQQAVVREVYPDGQILLFLLDDKKVMRCGGDNVDPVEPVEGDTLRVIRGANKGQDGTFINQDAADVIVQWADGNISMRKITDLCKVFSS